MLFHASAENNEPVKAAPNVPMVANVITSGNAGEKWLVEIFPLNPI